MVLCFNLYTALSCGAKFGYNDGSRLSHSLPWWCHMVLCFNLYTALSCGAKFGHNDTCSSRLSHFLPLLCHMEQILHQE